MPVYIVEGDILKSTAQYIIHQTNCVSLKASGLAGSIFEKYPQCNIYNTRGELNIWHKPGHIYIVGNVINAMGQFFPGKPHSEKIDGILVNDTEEQRIEWFKMCLARVLKLPNLQSIDFPWKIGCGLAGGNWNEYKKIIGSFQRRTPATVQIIKRKEDS